MNCEGSGLDRRCGLCLERTGCGPEGASGCLDGVHWDAGDCSRRPRPHCLSRQSSRSVRDPFRIAFASWDPPLDPARREEADLSLLVRLSNR